MGKRLPNQNVSPPHISPIMGKLRALLLGRTHMGNHRFEEKIANRTQPDPEVPGGPAHLLSANYYYARDARREMEHPTVLAAQGKLIGSGETEVDTRVKSKTPGAVYKYSQ